MSASPATGAGEAMGQDPALEVLAQVPLDEPRDGPAGGHRPVVSLLAGRGCDRHPCRML